MTINEQNIVKRWNMMASKDLGTDRNIEAVEIAELMKSVFEDEFTQVHTGHHVNMLFNEFLYSEFGMYDDCSWTECLGLSHINITKDAAKDFDWWLMNRKNWFMRYQYAVTQAENKIVC